LSGLYNPDLEHSSCGVGFLTRKDGVQTHDVIRKLHEALCAVPHRGGMSSEGVGDGAGVNLDLSLRFFAELTGRADLQLGQFGVGNFFLPTDPAFHAEAESVIEAALLAQGFDILVKRDVPVDNSAIRPAAVKYQLPIRQWVFTLEPHADRKIHDALMAIEGPAYTRPELLGLYPLSLSARTQAQLRRGGALLQRSVRSADGGAFDVLPHPLLHQHGAQRHDGPAVPVDGAQR
jgi:glutamate synthase (NADPH/NADH) large chain